jgi:hypothetical protein
MNSQATTADTSGRESFLTTTNDTALTITHSPGNLQSLFYQRETALHQNTKCLRRSHSQALNPEAQRPHSK